VSAPQADAAVGLAAARPAATATATDQPPATRGPLPGWIVVAGPAVAELVVGGYQISGPSLWRDEAATIVGSQRPAGAIIALARNQDAVHGPYYMLMHFVIAVGGRSEAVLRLPSLIAMCLAVALTAVLARRLALAAALPAPGVTGLAAGLLLVAVPLTTRYAQEARPYALTTLFAVLASYLLVRAAGSSRWTWWAGYAAALTLTGLFNLFAVLLAVAHGVSLLVARRVRSVGPATASELPGSDPTPTEDAKASPGGTVGTDAAAGPDLTVSQDVAARGAAAGPAAMTDRAAMASLAGQTPGDANSVPAAAGPSRLPAYGPVRPGLVGWVADGAIARWLIACAAAAVLLAPLAIWSAGQSGQLNWVTTPDLSVLASLVRDFAGSALLVPVVAFVAGLGCAAGRGLRTGSGLTLAVVAVPWLVLPPAVLLAASFVHPVYVERYVVFCLPALSVLAAAGLTWLTALTRMSMQRREGRAGQPARLLAAAPSAVLVLVIVAGLIGPQRAIRLASARPDNLRAVAAVVAAHEQPGDAIVYLPWDTRMIGMAYPAPFQRLRDVEVGIGPVASATLRGLQAPAALVAARLRGVGRVWTVQWTQQLTPGGLTQTDLVATAAIRRMRLIERWRVGSVVLSLYTAR